MAFGVSKQAWLKTFLSLPHGISSYDRVGRVFALWDPVRVERCFSRWAGSLEIDLERQVIALDGKTLGGSGNKRRGYKVLPLVSAWACEQRVMPLVTLTTIRRLVLHLLIQEISLKRKPQEEMTSTY